jgi:tetratricopeptide (TPR) repeat protein/transcriptional regulator with XRE-family HTH domain
MPEVANDPLESFGAALRRLRSEKGVSQSALGSLVHYSKGHLSKLENNVAPANLEIAEACDTALGANGWLIAAFLSDMSQLPAPASGGQRDQIPFDIPPSPSHFTGRAADAAHVIEAILSAQDPRRAAVVLIHGMPGIGKTALAVHVAHTVRTRFPGGCLFVDFGQRLSEPLADGLHARMLRRLGVSGDATPTEPDEAHALYLSLLYRRPVLVIADGVSSAAQVRALQAASSACAVIATARGWLDALDDCHRVRLGPLTGDDAASLFAAVAREPDGLTETCPTAALAQITGACGGVPLALRVAAAKLRGSGRSAGELAAALTAPETGWAELDDGERSVHQTLRAEYEAMPASRQRTLTMLALHPRSSADRHAIAWLADSSPSVVAADLATLARQDFVTLVPVGRASADGLIRALALSVPGWLEEPARGEALHRMISGYARSATAADIAITPQRFQPADPVDAAAAAPVPLSGRAQAIAWSQTVAELVPELCAIAYTLGRDADCWRLAYAMRDYFFATRSHEPWAASHRTALLAAQRCGDAWARAVTGNNLGLAYVEQGRVAAAEAEYARALGEFRALGDSHGVATTLGHQAWAHHVAGRHDAAVAAAGNAIDLHRRHGNERSFAIMSRTAALAQAALGRHREALRHLADSEETLSGLDLPLDVAMTFNCLGEVYCAMGALDQADASHQRAAELSVACSGRGELARADAGRQAVAQAAGRAADSEARADYAGRHSAPT